MAILKRSGQRSARPALIRAVQDRSVVSTTHIVREAFWSAPAPWRFWSKANQKADELMLRTAVSKNPAEIVELLFVK